MQQLHTKARIPRSNEARLQAFKDMKADPDMSSLLFDREKRLRDFLTLN